MFSLGKHKVGGIVFRKHITYSSFVIFVFSCRYKKNAFILPFFDVGLFR